MSESVKARCFWNDVAKLSRRSREEEFNNKVAEIQERVKMLVKCKQL